MLFPMIAGNDTLQNLMIDFFIDASIPYPSAMIQRRSKIKPSAFLQLFYRFTQKIPALKTFHGNRLIAMDGTRLNFPYNPSDPDTFIKSIKDRKGINQMHLNAMYDILNDVFVDFELQSIHQRKMPFAGFLKTRWDLRKAFLLQTVVTQPITSLPMRSITTNFFLFVCRIHLPKVSALIRITGLKATLSMLK